MGFASGFVQGFGQRVLDDYDAEKGRHQARVDRLTDTAISRAVEDQGKRKEKREKTRQVAGKLSSLFGGGATGKQKAYLLLKQYGSPEAAEQFYTKAQAVLELDPNAHIDDIAQYTIDEGMTDLTEEQMLQDVVPKYVWDSKLPKIDAKGLYGLLEGDDDIDKRIRKDMQSIGINTEKGQPTVGMTGRVRINQGMLAHPKEAMELRLMRLKGRLTDGQIEALSVETQQARAKLGEFNETQQDRVALLRQQLRTSTLVADSQQIQNDISAATGMDAARANIDATRAGTDASKVQTQRNKHQLSLEQQFGAVEAGLKIDKLRADTDFTKLSSMLKEKYGQEEIEAGLAKLRADTDGANILNGLKAKYGEKEILAALEATNTATDGVSLDNERKRMDNDIFKTYGRAEAEVAIQLEKAKVLQTNRPEDAEEFLYGMKHQLEVHRQTMRDNKEGSEAYNKASKDASYFAKQIVEAASVVSAEAKKDLLSKMNPYRAYNAVLSTELTRAGIKHDIVESDIDTRILTSIEGNSLQVLAAHAKAREAFAKGYGGTAQGDAFLNMMGAELDSLSEQASTQRAVNDTISKARNGMSKGDVIERIPANIPKGKAFVVGRVYRTREGKLSVYIGIKDGGHVFKTEDR